jgi:hypothetical protein
MKSLVTYSRLRGLSKLLSNMMRTISRSMSILHGACSYRETSAKPLRMSAKLRKRTKAKQIPSIFSADAIWLLRTTRKP